MSYELFLSRLDRGQPDNDDHLPLLVHSIACTFVPKDDNPWSVSDIQNGAFEIEMASGIGTMQDSHIAFRLQRFSAEIAKLIFRIADEANLDIINESGKPHVIVTNSSRIKSVQAALLSETPVVCNSPEEFAAILSANFPEIPERQSDSIRRRNLLYSIWTRNHEIRSIGSGDPEPNVPGLGPKRDEVPIYIEAKDGEGPLLLGRRLSRYLKACINSGLQVPDGGGFRGSGWQIRLPDNSVFTCKFVRGYHYSASRMSRVSQERRIEFWKQIISDFANETRRRTGVIESQVFIVSDGSKLPMKLCESRRAQDEEG